MNSIKVETVRVHGGERFSFRSLMKTPNYGVATRTLRRGGYLQNYVRKFNQPTEEEEEEEEDLCQRCAFVGETCNS